MLEFAIGVDVVEARLPLVTIIRLGKKLRCMKIPKEGTQEFKVYQTLLAAGTTFIHVQRLLRARSVALAVSPRTPQPQTPI